MPLRFDETDHQRVTAAIRRAEQHTAGEIYAVFARRSADEAPISYAVALALCILCATLAALIAHLAGAAVPALTLALAQLAGAAILITLLRYIPALREFFAPAFIARLAAARVAREQFIAHNLHVTEARTGVLLFVSEAEHYAEVIADEGIAEKVPAETWARIVDLLTQAARDDHMADGFVEAVAETGKLLAEAFPAGPENRNELPDRLVEM